MISEEINVIKEKLVMGLKLIEILEMVDKELEEAKKVATTISFPWVQMETYVDYLEAKKFMIERELLLL